MLKFCYCFFLFSYSFIVADLLFSYVIIYHLFFIYIATLQSQLYQKGIRVTVVCPGPIETSTSSGAEVVGKKGVSEVCRSSFILCQCSCWLKACKLNKKMKVLNLPQNSKYIYIFVGTLLSPPFKLVNLIYYNGMSRMIYWSTRVHITIEISGNELKLQWPLVQHWISYKFLGNWIKTS